MLRGHDFRWDEERGRSPHLPDDAAHALIEMVSSGMPQSGSSATHESSSTRPPGTSQQNSKGSKARCRRPEFDLLALRPTSDWRLLRFGRYPPLRGTAPVGGDQSMLYTNGWVPELGYDHGHVPSPLEITDHHGDTSRSSSFVKCSCSRR